MDYKIIWLDDALQDLDHALQFIADDNPLAAGRFGGTILKKVALLAQFPRLGKIYQKLNRENVREVLVDPYWIIYRVEDAAKTVSIITVWHTARQEPELE